MKSNILIIKNERYAESESEMKMLFSEMTKTQKVTALTEGKHLKYIGQGNFETCIILQNDGLDVEVQWEDGRKDWISINSFGPTWKLLNAN